MHPSRYWRSLTIGERERFAKRLGTSVDYIRNHIFPKLPRQPDRGIHATRLHDWVRASQAIGPDGEEFTLEELLAHLSGASDPVSSPHGEKLSQGDIQVPSE